MTLEDFEQQTNHTRSQTLALIRDGALLKKEINFTTYVTWASPDEHPTLVKTIEESTDTKDSKDAKKKTAQASAKKKSYGLLFLLVFLFGPFGLFYSRPLGAIILLAIGIPWILYAASDPAGLPVAVLIILNIIAIVSGMTGIKKYNSAISAQGESS